MEKDPSALTKASISCSTSEELRDNLTLYSAGRPLAPSRDTRPLMVTVLNSGTFTSVLGFTVVTRTTSDANRSFVASIEYVPRDKPEIWNDPHKRGAESTFVYR